MVQPKMKLVTSAFLHWEEVIKKSTLPIISPVVWWHDLLLAMFQYTLSISFEEFQKPSFKHIFNVGEENSGINLCCSYSGVICMIQKILSTFLVAQKYISIHDKTQKKNLNTLHQRKHPFFTSQWLYLITG